MSIHPFKPFELPAALTGEQVLAIIELLDDLREHLAAKYSLELIEICRQQGAQEIDDDHGQMELFHNDTW